MMHRQMIICNRENATFEASKVGKGETNKQTSKQSPSLEICILTERGEVKKKRKKGKRKNKGFNFNRRDTRRGC